MDRREEILDEAAQRNLQAAKKAEEASVALKAYFEEGGGGGSGGNLFGMTLEQWENMHDYAREHSANGYIHLYIPEGVTEVPPYAFAYQMGNVSVKMPSTIKKIGRCAFLRSSAGPMGEPLPYGLEEIGDEAFRSSMTQATKIPSTIKKIGVNAFYQDEDTGSPVFIDMSWATIEQVKSMENYPWGLRGYSRIYCDDGEIEIQRNSELQGNA